MNENCLGFLSKYNVSLNFDVISWLLTIKSLQIYTDQGAFHSRDIESTSFHF